VRLQLDEIKRTHREAFEALREAGIGVNLHYTPVHLQPYYRALGFEEGMFPEAEAYGRDAISLPMYPSLNEVEKAEISIVLKECFGE
jgi:dTDP-4-amino-4,6-dideoxygalactose transaminase